MGAIRASFFPTVNIKFLYDWHALVTLSAITGVTFTPTPPRITFSACLGSLPCSATTPRPFEF
jgi:hypothetical protein